MNTSHKKAMGLAFSVSGFLICIIMVTPLIVRTGLLPKTAIGYEGLLNVRRYFRATVLSHIIAAALILPVIELGALIFRKTAKGGGLKLRTRLIISAVLTVAFLALYPRATEYDGLIIKNGYKGVNLTKAVGFLIDLDRDVKEQQTLTYSGETRLVRGIYQYRDLGSTGRNLRLETRSASEYMIYDNDENILTQVSAVDFAKLGRSVFIYTPHEIVTYARSGITAELDGSGSIESLRPLSELITLEFDYDAGVLRRELICEDESLLPDLILHTTMDGEYAGSCTINGFTEIPFKPMVPGHAEARVEIRDADRHIFETVSNIITYDQTEYVY